jgi:dTDP-4-dehydrorhamnose reductase
MNTFLLIGGDSQLARQFHKRYPDESIVLTRLQCDITSEKSIEHTLKNYPATYVLNCAAVTDMEACEKDKMNCLTVNTTGVYLLNTLCNTYKKKLIHISSNYAVSPTNTYGWSKYLSERIVDPEDLVIRTSFFSERTYVINKLLKKEKVQAYTNLFFNPLSIYTLVEYIQEEKQTHGIQNIFSSKKISYYDFALLVCKKIKLDHTHYVQPILYDNKKNMLTRPLNSFIKPDVHYTINSELDTFFSYGI